MLCVFEVHGKSRAMQLLRLPTIIPNFAFVVLKIVRRIQLTVSNSFSKYALRQYFKQNKWAALQAAYENPTGLPCT